MEGESIEHVFFECELSRGFWRHVNPEFLNHRDFFMNERGSWRLLIEFWWKKGLLEQWMYIFWLLWHNRNNSLLKMSCMIPTNLGDMAVKLKEGYSKTMATPDLGEKATRRIWSPPTRDQFKINADVTFSNGIRVVSLGVVVRNMEAEVCISTVTKMDGINSPLQAELCAILFGLQVVRKWNLKEIQIERDSLIAIKEIQKESSYNEWRSILFDIWDSALNHNLCFFGHVSTRKSDT